MEVDSVEKEKSSEIVVKSPEKVTEEPKKAKKTVESIPEPSLEGDKTNKEVVSTETNNVSLTENKTNDIHEVEKKVPEVVTPQEAKIESTGKYLK